MTQLSTPTESLVHIPFTGLTDFQPLALAPGLPMLDVNKLTYQVLLGWFGDLLAEPELDDEGVVFHVQKNGTRQLIVERALATSEELHSSLQPQYEKLKNSLFDVKPVSPSERLIFNRLQPPIGNHEGFLYRVQTEAGEEQLVWCWGFQRRTQYGDARLCENPDCSMLFLHDSLADAQCPHCGTPFGVDSEEELNGRSKFPIGKASAAAAVLLLAGGTFWIGSNLTNLSADTVSEVPEVQSSESVEGLLSYDDAVPKEDEKPTDDNSTDPVDSTTQVAEVSTDVSDPEPSAVEPPEFFVGFNDLPDVDQSNELPEAPALPEPALPSVVSLPDLPDNLDSEKTETIIVETPESTVAEEPERSLPIVKADKFPQDKTDGLPDLPDVLPEPLVVQTDPAAPADSDDSTSDTEATPLADGAGLKTDTEPVTRPETAKPELPDSADTLVLTDPVEEPTTEASAEPLSWHDDYLAAYVEAAKEKRYLLMFFRDVSFGEEPLASAETVFTPSLRPMLEQFSRVELPLNAAMPVLSDKEDGSQKNELPDLLLKHRSFRHLGMRPGIAVVDLTDPGSQNHARVVSVLPMPESGQYNDDDLMLALNLPKGAISQRTLLLAIRSTVPDSSLSMREFSPALIELAHRNSQYMARAGKAGSFDQENRQQRIEEEFGPQAELKQLVFATDSKTTIQDAALQAVTSWIGTSESFDILDTPAEAMGMDMFQDSKSGRWFVTCFVIR